MRMAVLPMARCSEDAARYGSEEDNHLGAHCGFLLLEAFANPGDSVGAAAALSEGDRRLCVNGLAQFLL